MMKTTKRNKKRRQQQQSGSVRSVLVTFYVVRPRRDGGGTAAVSWRDVHHYHHHHHHHLHGGARDARRWGSNDSRYYDRRADLLEYSRQLRATAATTPQSPHRRNINTVGAVRHDYRQPAADDRRLGRRRLERARSQQQVSQSCFGGAWNWKRVLMLVFPFHDNINVVGRNKSKRSTTKHSNDNDSKINDKAWPAALLVGRLKVRRTTTTDDKGLVKKLLSMFRQQSRLNP